MLNTKRLELIPATAELIRLEISDPAALGMQLDVHIPSGWPPEEVRSVLEIFASQFDDGIMRDGWGVYYWVARADGEMPRTLVGSGGFTSSPTYTSVYGVTPPSSGFVEIGYGTLDEFQGRGYATEAVSGLAQWALSQPEVSLVMAEALLENPASVRVLEKNGFADAGLGQEEGTRRFERRAALAAFAVMGNVGQQKLVGSGAVPPLNI